MRRTPRSQLVFGWWFVWGLVVLAGPSAWGQTAASPAVPSAEWTYFGGTTAFQRYSPRTVQVALRIPASSPSWKSTVSERKPRRSP